MADDIRSDRRNVMYWSKIEMDSEEDGESYIPGITVSGNRRPVRMKGKKTQEVKAKIPVKQPVIVEDLTVTPSSSSTLQELSESFEDNRKFPRASHVTKASLKDLCAEDKKRVANLIKELARMGDEREKAVGQLHEERTQFEKQVITLVEQQEQILKEREDIQRNLFQCQDLIKRYQKAILDKEEKLNTSLSDMAKNSVKNMLVHYQYQIQDRQNQICEKIHHIMDDQHHMNMLVHYQYQIQDRQNQICEKIHHIMDDQHRMSRFVTEKGEIKNILKENVILTPPKGHSSPKEKKIEHHNMNIKLQSSLTSVDVKHKKSNENQEIGSPKPLEKTGQKQNRDDIPPLLTQSPRIQFDDRRFSSSPGINEQDKENIPTLFHNNGNQNTESLKSNAYKPYTSQIDKEIAHQKSVDLKDGPSTIVPDISERGAFNYNRQRMEYPEKVPSFKRFRDPIMSSTQKSAEIHKYMPDDDEFQPLVPDQSPRSSKVSASMQELSPHYEKQLESGKVGFKDNLEELNEDGKIHSPNLPRPENTFGDKNFMEYYRKLNSNQRKKELLKQRENLLLEQERLKHILIQQEHKLNKKKEQLDMQQKLQKERLDYFQQNGKFPLKKPDFYSKDVSLHENVRYNQQDDSVFNGEIEKLDFDKPISECDAAELAAEVEKENDASLIFKSKVTAAASPIPKPEIEKPLHSIATSPIRMEQSKAIQHTPPRGIDAATSISYHNIGLRSPKSPTSQDFTAERQGNLPLHSNRQRTPKTHLSPSPSVSKTPGDKTMSIVEIVNSLEESPSWNGSVRGHKTSPARTKISSLIQNESIDDDKEVTEEESRILEDIFFLK